jgi:hypothetical protein
LDVDDPVFDPWGGEPEAAPARASGRWSAPATPPTLPAPRSRLAGTPGFLRTMAAPRLEQVAHRLEMARHGAAVEDLLDGVPPAIRLTVRPWSNPMDEDVEPAAGMLEFVVEPGAHGMILAQSWTGASFDVPLEELRVPPGSFGAAWLEARVLDFLARLLGR